MDIRMFRYAFFGGVCGMLLDLDHVPAYAGLAVDGRFLHLPACVVGLVVLGVLMCR